jgi:type II secretory pathway pseudopilin PulG
VVGNPECIALNPKHGEIMQYQSNLLLDDAAENSIMQTITIAVSAILIAAGLVTAPGLINNARDNNATTDLSNIAYAQEVYLGDKGSYADLDTLIAAGRSQDADKPAARITLSGQTSNQEVRFCTDPDAWVARTTSASGKTFYRSSASATTSSMLSEIELASCLNVENFEVAQPDDGSNPGGDNGGDPGSSVPEEQPDYVNPNPPTIVADPEGYKAVSYDVDYDAIVLPLNRGSAEFQKFIPSTPANYEQKAITIKGVTTKGAPGVTTEDLSGGYTYILAQDASNRVILGMNPGFDATDEEMYLFYKDSVVQYTVDGSDVVNSIHITTADDVNPAVVYRGWVPVGATAPMPSTNYVSRYALSDQYIAADYSTYYGMQNQGYISNAADLNNVKAGRYINANKGKDIQLATVRAFVDGKEITINGSGWVVNYDTESPAHFGVRNVSGGKVGANAQEEADFFARGVMTFTVPGDNISPRQISKVSFGNG